MSEGDAEACLRAALLIAGRMRVRRRGRLAGLPRCGIMDMPRHAGLAGGRAGGG